MEFDHSTSDLAKSLLGAGVQNTKKPNTTAYYSSSVAFFITWSNDCRETSMQNQSKWHPKLRAIDYIIRQIEGQYRSAPSTYECDSDVFWKTMTPEYGKEGKPRILGQKFSSTLVRFVRRSMKLDEHNPTAFVANFTPRSDYRAWTKVDVDDHPLSKLRPETYVASKYSSWNEKPR